MNALLLTVFIFIFFNTSGGVIEASEDYKVSEPNELKGARVTHHYQYELANKDKPTKSSVVPEKKETIYYQDNKNDPINFKFIHDGLKASIEVGNYDFVLEILKESQFRNLLFSKKKGVNFVVSMALDFYMLTKVKIFFSLPNCVRLSERSLVDLVFMCAVKANRCDIAKYLLTQPGDIPLFNPKALKNAFDIAIKSRNTNMLRLITAPTDAPSSTGKGDHLSNPCVGYAPSINHIKKIYSDIGNEPKTPETVAFLTFFENHFSYILIHF
ncbi:MAG: hypothetical protein Q8S21_06575 [Candidatus Paracaedibacteraceae bacterium]|nr:hypothetical protein [Candidatus Paracaedibacteraceae bacterium]